MARRSWWLAVVLGLVCVSAAAEDAFTLGEYRRMKTDDATTLEMVLGAMYETAVYAQASIEHPVVCFSPVPLAGVDLVAMVDAEVSAPTGSPARTYAESDHVSLILVNALKSQGLCR